MACFHPLRAWRRPNGVVVLREPAGEEAGREFLRLPCGTCIGCRKARAREWALRCTLELSAHEHACWATLTYDEHSLPPSLRKDHLAGWLKRLRRRSDVAVRFFASGEYGERTQRPHYHAILFGVAPSSGLPQSAWPHGFVRVDPLTPAAISYVAGYCSKKLGWKLDKGERIDYTTGEVYEYQPPFVQMSRRPGIASAARHFVASWRSQAVLNGTPMPVPRYLHKAWIDQASDDQLIKLREEKASIVRDVSRARLEAAEQIAVSLHGLSSAKRMKL